MITLFEVIWIKHIYANAQKFGVGMIFKCVLLSYIIKTELSVLKTVVLLIYLFFVFLFRII